MAEFKIDGRMTVRTLKENFKNTFEGTLRIYDGREKADDSATLASIRKNDVKTGEYVCRGSRTVGKFIEEMEEVFGISIKVASPDDWVLALDGITLANLKNIKKNATKADMEELVAYKRKGEEMDEEDYDDDYDDDDENDKFEIKDGVCIIPEGTTEIGDYAFNSCDELTSIVIPNSVTSIGECAFEGCIGLTSIEIPNSVTKIDYSAFQDCNGLTSVVIPNSVTEIGDSAFDGCWKLTSIEIPDSVTKIGRCAFAYCEGLTNIKVADGNPVYDSRGGCNAIIETESNKLLFGCQSTVIPDSVTEIGKSAFHGRTVLTSIEIPDSVTEIGDCAFQGCTRLTSVEISDSVTEIGCYAFACCGLTNIVIPDSVTNIGGSAFNNCTGLTNVEIHSSEIEFGRGVFSYCENLKSIKVPANTADYFKEILPEELHDLIVEMGESDGNQAKTTKKSYPVFDFALKKIDWELTEDNIEKYREEIDNYGVVVVRALNEDEDFETKVICNGDVADLLYDAMESVEDFENDDWPEVNVYYSTLCEVYGTKEKVWKCREYIFRVLGSYLGDDGYDWGAETGYELLCRVKWLDDDIVNVWKTDKRGDYKDDVDEDMVEEMLEKHSEKSND
ncbi:MAG: leucine-rich repeat domain-containing protein [Bacteroidales bacterium]|nr:leucine-rich repeat domain-containing protein [Bacteroidales bacterium]